MQPSDGKKASDGLRLYNHDKSIITNDSVQEFIDDIQRELETGFGFVPFIGAGLSAPSGAPLVWEIKAYLERCIGLALAVEEPGMRPWNPRTDQWPPFIDRTRPLQDDWWTRIRDELERRRQEDPWDIEVPVFQEALGAMAEWRTALLFLSRLVREQRGIGRDSRELLALDAPDQEVIDACIREVMQGKQPTLGHRMLANLGGLLRLDIILSTNFDDLLERAFASARNPLTVFEVHLNSLLPHWSALSGQRSLVKLHGHRHSMRADYTLDALPSEADRWRFLEYLITAESRQDMFSSLAKGVPKTKLQVNNHLLIMGFSASDRRSRALIEHSWLHLDPSFKVFWLCHSQTDVDRVCTFTRDFLAKNKAQLDESFKSGTWMGSRILRHQYLGLFFLQLYQSIRHGLPTTGMVFPSVSRVPVPPMPRLRDSLPAALLKSVADPFRRRLEHRLAAFRSRDFRDHKLLAITSAPDAQGITSLCAEIYEALEEKGIICLWLDMNDISSTDDLFEQLLDAAYYRLGAENWMPVFLAKNPRPRAAEIRRLAQSTSSPWVIFLNARETPGANVAEYAEMFDQARPNNWLDDARPQDDPPASYTDEYSRCHNALGELLVELCGPQSQTISVVILCRQSKGASPPPLAVALKAYGLLDELDCLDEDCTTFDETQAIAESIKWTNNEPHRRRFVHALCLMQRPRLMSTIWSSAMSPADETGDGSVQVDRLDWLNELEGHGLIRRKPGGFIWMHSRPRNRLREILANADTRKEFLANRADIAEYFQTWKPEDDGHEIHHELSKWFRRVLAATNSPAAVFEAVYHACSAASAILRAQSQPSAIHRACESIDGASALLQTHSFLIQTHGYSRGSCRRLEYIRDKMCARICSDLDALSARLVPEDTDAAKPVVDRLQGSTALLQIRCTEVMRAIAREVGEDRRAYQRQREIRALFASRAVNDAEDVETEEVFDRFFRPVAQGAQVGHISDAGIEWMRWWKWNGMLGIASRSYEKARRSLLRGLSAATRLGDVTVTRDTPYPFRDVAVVDDTELAAEIGKLVEQCSLNSLRICGALVADMQQARIELLRIIEQIVAQRLQVSSLDRRVGEEKAVRTWSPTDGPALRAIIRCALELADQILAYDQSADAHHTIPTMWCKSRLLMHDGICAAQERQWDEAMKLLADAEACLNYFDIRRQGTDRALVELHRAEVRLLQANATQVLQDRGASPGRELSFREMCDELSNREPGEFLLWRTAGESLYGTWFHGQPGAAMPADPGLSRAKALVHDAIRFLTRGEQVLYNRRRNVWWTTWFFQRKLMAVAMSVWATVPERGTPIPFLGLEAAPRKTPTMADAVLEDAIRMSRVDAYRLATIIDEYTSCACALHLRLMLDPGARRLPERQTAMTSSLAAAIARLAEVQLARQEWREDVSGKAGSREKVDKDAKVDKEIEDYIEAVIQRAKHRSRYLQNPLV